MPDPGTLTRPRAARLLGRLAALCITLLLATTARGQGLPMLPDPVSTSDLMDYADLLDLSSEQRLGLEPLHDGYLQRFTRLREREIEDFKDGLLDVGLRFAANRFEIPPRDQLERLIKQYGDCLERITAVDRTLFSALEPLLTEEQVIRLPRIRHRRELEVYSLIATEFGGEFNPGAGVNLSSLLERSDLTADEQTGTESIIAGYESARLSRVRVLDEVLREAATVVLDTIDQLGVRDMTRDELMQFAAEMMADEELVASLQATFDEASRPFQAAAFELSQLNAQTYRRLAAVLEKESGQRLRDRYYRRAYGRVYRGPGAWVARYEKALQLAGLADDVAAQIRHERSRLAGQDRLLVDGIVDDLEAAREYRSFARLSRQESDPIEAKIDDFRQRRSALEEQALATLHGLLGPRLVAQLDREEPDGEEPSIEVIAGARQTTTVQRSDGTTSVVAVEGMAAEPPAPDFEIPTPISVETVGHYAARLGWSGSERAVLESLFDDYRDRFEQLRTDAVATAADEDEADDSTPAADPVQPFRDLDESFFDDLGLLVTDDHGRAWVRCLRQARRRSVDAELAAAELDGSGRAVIDLVAVILEHEGLAADVPELPELLASYDEKASPLFARRLELAGEVARRMAMLQAMGSRGGEEARALSRSVREKWQEAWAEHRRTMRQISTLNQRSLDDLLARLPAEAGQSLVYTYRRAAYPEVFEDSDRVEAIIAAARSLDDVTPAQRERLLEVASDFRAAYFALSDRLIDLRQAREASGGFDGMPSRAAIEREIESERLEFAQEELCDRARLRLSATLSTAQRRHLERQLDGRN